MGLLTIEGFQKERGETEFEKKLYKMMQCIKLQIYETKHITKRINVKKSYLSTSKQND